MGAGKALELARQCALMKTLLSIAPLGFPWQTLDPFLFCVHHNDAYPAGNAQMAPDPALLAGRKAEQAEQAQQGNAAALTVATRTDPGNTRTERMR